MEERPKYIIRDWHEGKDEVKLAQILSECFGLTTPRQVNRWIRKSGGKTFVLEVDGEIVSTVGLEFKELHLGESVYLKTAGIAGVCTCSDCRRKGLMTDLLAQSLTYIKNSGVSNSALYTGLMLPAHRIYQRFGFCDVQTWPIYIKFLDFSYYFRTWLRNINRNLKVSKIARKTLQGWNCSVIFELKTVSAHSFRFDRDRFRRLSKPSKSADIIIVTNPETLIRIFWGAIKWKNALEAGVIKVKQGNEADIRILRKIMTGIWDD